MRTIEVKLKHGLIIGEMSHNSAVVREVTTADILDASEESERVVPTQQGYELVVSPTMMGIHTLRRQIVAIGDHKGPLSLGEVKRLHPEDLNLIQQKAETLEAAALEAVTRGRDDQGAAGT
jgi:phage FluMu protein gp41